MERTKENYKKLAQEEFNKLGLNETVFETFEASKTYKAMERWFCDGKAESLMRATTRQALNGIASDSSKWL